jgi:hypothetical protein
MCILRNNITLRFNKTKSNESTTLFMKFKELRANTNEQTVVSIALQYFVRWFMMDYASLHLSQRNVRQTYIGYIFIGDCTHVVVGV